MIRYSPLVIFLLLHVPVQGQAILALVFGKKIQNDNIALGVHLALQASDLTHPENTEMLRGFAFGAYTDVRLGSGKLQLSNYFIFKSPRGAHNLPLAYQIQPDVQGAADATLKRRLTYMEISPLLRYSITPGLSVAAGPQFAFLTVQKDIYTTELDDGGREVITYKLKDAFNKVDIAVAADLQYAFNKGKGLRLNFRYSIGFINVYKPEVPFDAMNQYFQLGLGIPIAIGTVEESPE